MELVGEEGVAEGEVSGGVSGRGGVPAAGAQKTGVEGLSEVLRRVRQTLRSRHVHSAVGAAGPRGRAESGGLGRRLGRRGGLLLGRLVPGVLGRLQWWRSSELGEGATHELTEEADGKDGAGGCLTLVSGAEVVDDVLGGLGDDGAVGAGEDGAGDVAGEEVSAASVEGIWDAEETEAALGQTRLDRLGKDGILEVDREQLGPLPRRLLQCRLQQAARVDLGPRRLAMATTSGGLRWWRLGR